MFKNKFLPCLLTLALLSPAAALADEATDSSAGEEDGCPAYEQANNDASWRTLGKGTYVVGTQLTAGDYLVAPVEDSFGGQVIVFADKEAFESYQDELGSSYTTGEKETAIGKYALASTYVSYFSDHAYLGLREGNVLAVSGDDVLVAPISLQTNQPCSEAALALQEAPNASVYTGTLFIGTDLNAGEYTISCQSDSRIGMYLFNTNADYQNYVKSSRTTFGEEADAIEANAAYSQWLYGEDSYTLYLEEGNVLLFDGGPASIASTDGTAEDAAMEVASISTVHPGVYFVGTDIPAASYVLEGTDVSWSIDVVVFETIDSYRIYLQSERSTGGEERQAIEQNALCEHYVFEGDACRLNLREGMVLMLSYGCGELIALDDTQD